MEKQNDYNHIYDLCKRYMHSYVLIELVDGSQVDGIITGIDDDNAFFAVPNGAGQQMNFSHRNNEDRQFGYGYGYGYPGYGYPGYGYPGYGYPGGRFSRLVLPLAAIAALTLLPWY